MTTHNTAGNTKVNQEQVNKAIEAVKSLKTKAEPTMAIVEGVRYDMPKSAGHTPGPWKLKRELYESCTGIICGDKVIGYVFQTHCEPDRELQAENQANARLIAQAPEMLEVLEANAIRFPVEFNTTLKKCDCNQFLDTGNCRHVLALNVINKAKGKE